MNSMVYLIGNVPRGTEMRFRAGSYRRESAGCLCARLIDERQRLLFPRRRRRRFQLQLLLPAERGHFATVGLKVALRGFESFLCFVLILADVFELVLVKVERLLRLRVFGAALLKALA